MRSVKCAPNGIKTKLICKQKKEVPQSKADLLILYLRDGEEREVGNLTNAEIIGRTGLHGDRRYCSGDFIGIKTKVCNK